MTDKAREIAVRHMIAAERWDETLRDVMGEMDYAEMRGRLANVAARSGVHGMAEAFRECAESLKAWRSLPPEDRA